MASLKTFSVCKSVKRIAKTVPLILSKSKLTINISSYKTSKMWLNLMTVCENG